MLDYSDQALISYVGTHSSIDASESIIDFIARGNKPELALLLSSSAEINSNIRHHGFFLQFHENTTIIISPRYTSGYIGTGSTNLSKILPLLENIFDQVLEYSMSSEPFNRLKKHQLLNSDIDKIINSAPTMYSKGNLENYITQNDFQRAYNLNVLNDFKARLPLTMLDSKLNNIALNIFNNPIDTIREACSIVEITLKEKSGLDESGTKLFDSALKPRTGKLKIKNCDDYGEQAGLQFLAKGFYQLHRNPIMHKTKDMLNKSVKASISELLIANHLLLQFSRLVENPNYSGSI